MEGSRYQQAHLVGGARVLTDKMTETENQGPSGALVFSVDGHPPSPNVTRRLHWGERARQCKVFKDAIGWQARAKASEEPWPVAHADITVYYRRKPWHDHDNAVAMCKPVIDGLKHGGLIVDDRPATFSYCVTQQAGPSNRIEVRVFEVHPPNG